MHDFVRETSLTTEEWMSANAFIFLFCYYSFHCFFFDLAVGRLLISSPRQARCALKSVKVCFNYRSIYKQWSHLNLSQSSYRYLILLESLPSSIRSIVSSPLVRLSAPFLDLSLLKTRMKVRTWFLRWTLFLISFHSSGKRRLDRIRREGRLHVCRRGCNRSPRKAHSQCNYWHLGDWWKWGIWYSGTWKNRLLRRLYSGWVGKNNDNLTVCFKRWTWMSRDTPFNWRWFIRLPCSGVSGLSFSI